MVTFGLVLKRISGGLFWRGATEMSAHSGTYVSAQRSNAHA